MQRTRAAVLTLLAAALLPACGGSDPLPSGLAERLPTERVCRHYNPQRNPYFGDLHVHTIFSLDANTQGTVTTPQQAYAYALGERLGLQPFTEAGQPLRSSQLQRPLDFAAVTDHAELFGEVEICSNPEERGYFSPECLLYRASPEQSFIIFNLIAVGLPELPQFPVPPGIPVVSDLPVIGTDGKVPRLPYCGVNGARCLEAALSPWRETQRAAEAFYDRSEDCRFTTFIGYEWTGAPLSNNLHRNVIFRSEVVPALPPAYQEHPSPEQLWAALDERCVAAEGCEWLSIPHNSNLSAGTMFEPRDRAGRDYTAEMAARRQVAEPLAEIYQHKGSSECLNVEGAGARDELCDFEILPYNNLTGERFGGLNTGPPVPEDFLRNALKEGLRLEQVLGVNPFKYGLIATTDTHLGTPGLANEADYPGHGGAGLGARDEVPPGLTDLIENSPGGLAVLWAEQNTRESLFAAMRRREAYATSGTRPIVRFYGGQPPDTICSQPDFAAIGDATGVPMGGDLTLPEGVAPRFAVSALRDPGVPGEPAQPLQRIQIIKGWIADGEAREQVFEVAGTPDNGAGVDLETCEPFGEGFQQLCAVWEDPAFDPRQSAFYYARIVENPSCRWSTRQCLAAGIDCQVPEAVPEAFAACCDAAIPKTVQERAWTSPIWVRPSAP